VNVLYVFLWLLAGIAGLLALVLLLLSVSVGIFISNRSGQTKIVARYGIFRYRIHPRKKRPEKKARRATRPKGRKPGKKKKKPGAEIDMFRSFLTAIFHYDYEYLRIFYVKRLEVDWRVGGKDSTDVGRRYARASELIGAAFPLLMRIFKIKKYRLTVIPDFVIRKNEFIYEAVLLIRPVVLIKAYLKWREGEKNRATGKSEKPEKAPDYEQERLKNSASRGGKA
jgi:hypothetical protein